MKQVRSSKSAGRSLNILHRSSSAFIVGYLAFSVVIAAPPKLPPMKPLEVKIPAVRQETLSCGLKVLFLKDDGMPLVSGSLLVPGGFVTDPPGKEGLVGLMNAALRSGGAGKLPPEAFDEALEDKAASMGASADLEHFSADFKCLAGDLDEVLGLFADMIRRPRFDPKRLETERGNLADSMKRLEDKPDTITRVLFHRAMYGKSPLGRWASPKDVLGVGRADVVKFHGRRYGPQGAVLALAGSFDEDKVLKRLETLFSGWRKQEMAPVYGDPEPLGPIVYFYPKDVTQAFVRFGLQGIRRHDPDQLSLQVANDVLGGWGFTSRLMQRIRSDRGLAYFVGSYFVPMNVKGPFQVVGGTRPDAVKEYLTLMFEELGKFKREGPTDEELKLSKDAMVEEFAFHFESVFKFLPYKADLDFKGYPEDHLATFRDRVRAVTKEEALRAARPVLDQKDWVLVVCGPADLEKMLSEFGKVVTVTDIFAPLPE